MCSWSGITHIQQMDYMFQLLQTLEDKQKARGGTSVVDLKKCWGQSVGCKRQGRKLAIQNLLVTEK